MDRIAEVLAKNKHLLEAVCDGFSLGMLLVKPDFSVAGMNAETRNLPGAGGKNKNNGKCYEMFGEKKPCGGCPALTAIKSGKPREAEIYFAAAGRHFEIKSFPVKGAGDGGAVNILKDVTGPRKAAEFLRESEERIKDITGFAGEYFWELDDKFRYTYISENYGQFFRCKKEEIIGKTPFSLMHPDDAAVLKARLKEELKKGTRASIEKYRMESRGGATAWRETRIAAIPGEKGGIAGYRGITRDITQSESEREKAEDEARLYRCILDGQDELVCYFEPDTTIIYANPAYARAVGMGVEELKGVRFINFSPPDEREKILEHLKTLTADRPAAKNINRVKTRDGRPLWIEWKNSALFNDGGEVESLRSVGRDVTARKTMEDKIKNYTLIMEAQDETIARKDAAFNEIVDYIERCKEELIGRVMGNLADFVFPALEKLKLKGHYSELVGLIHDNLKDIGNSFGSRVKVGDLHLTPAEIEICNMIRGNMTSKAISALLNVSPSTVEKHRKNIRKKLDISNKPVNLTAYLRGM